MDKITHEVRMNQWRQVVEQCCARPEGMSIKKWLKEQGIAEKTYFYWQRKVRQEAYDQMQQAALPAVCGDAEVTFAEIPVMQEPDPHAPASENAPAFRPAAVVHSGNCTIELSNSASGSLVKKNWVLIDSIKGAQASAVIYSISETAKLNGLSTYNYFCHLLTELPKLADKNGHINQEALDPLLPWAEGMPEKCCKPRR